MSGSILNSRVVQHRHELKHVLEELGASNIRLFGSVARGEDTAGSDVDLLVDVDDKVGLFALGRMRSEAERVLGVPVDIVPSSSLKQELVETVLTEATPL